MTPSDFTFGAKKKIWWKCHKAVDHDYQARIQERSRGRGCPYCSGKKVALSNCLATTDIELSKKWHPTKNKNLTPYDVSRGSGQNVWWKCDVAEDHEWEGAIHKTKNCPCCSGKKVVFSNSLYSTNPEIAKDWHPTKNGNLRPTNLTKGSSKKVWWKCDVAEDHEWKTSTTDKVGCPYCSGANVVLSTSLQSTHPEIIKYWHPTKNKNVTPKNVSSGSNKIVWWKCPKADDHEYKASIKTKTRGDGCPICRGLKVIKSNSFAFLYPEQARKWHPTKNRELIPSNFTGQSHKKVWWKCDNAIDHEWKARIADISNGKSNCPYCLLTPQSKQELIVTFEIKTIFKNIDPKGFKTRLDGKLRAIDIFIPSLNLAVEFDGSYWHKDKLALDKIKSEMLMHAGYKVIRIREEPLKKIYENDIIITHPYNGKQITDNVLRKILDLFDLDSKPISRIKNYLEKDSLQNEKGLDKYIDQILREKANN